MKKHIFRWIDPFAPRADGKPIMTQEACEAVEWVANETKGGSLSTPRREQIAALCKEEYHWWVAGFEAQLTAEATRQPKLTVVD